MKNFWLPILLTLAIGIPALNAQNAARTGKDHALFFVVTDFNEWPDFPPSSAQQVREIERELRDYYGFATEFVPDPTRRDIIDKLNAYAQRKYGNDDQLLIYFSTHGNYEQGRIGVLIPKDGKRSDPAYDSYIMHPLLEDLVTNIPCRHITLALDACYSGTFEGERGPPTKAPWENTGDCASKAASALQHQSRLYLTSGGAERTPINSQFAAKWLEALQVRNHDGMLSHHDLVAVVTEASPVPRAGKFKAHESRGDFVFVHKDACAGNGPVQPVQPVVIAPADLTGWVKVQGGTFSMGSTDGESDEQPVHDVTLGDFYLAAHELTFDEYDAYAKDMGVAKPSDNGWGRGRRPVINVSWLEAVEYCNWRSEQDGFQPVYMISNGTNVTAKWNANGYRLPTEAEWEFAARSRRKFKWAGTGEEGELKTYANGDISGDGYTNTAPVGSFQPNSLGLYDMSGNVWEWCWDWYGSYTSDSQTNPVWPASGSGRVIRGGSWYNGPASLRCANRGYSSPDDRYYYIGFRLARAAR